MTQVPHAITPGPFLAWRLDDARFADTWDSGEGAFRSGGRWNSPGIRAVYCSADPSTAILEVAVHKTFRVLDTVPHVMSTILIKTPKDVHVIMPDDVPNPAWLFPGVPSHGQQQFGDTLLRTHKFILIPSVVSHYSWNLIFDVSSVDAAYEQQGQERFALDTRLHPPRNIES